MSKLIARAIAAVESGGNYNARGQSGEIGKYQIMPSNYSAWAKQAGVDQNDTSPEAQDKIAQIKIADYSTKYGGDPTAVALAWNGGPGAADKYKASGTVPTIKGTNQYGANYDVSSYADKVKAAYQKALKDSFSNFDQKVDQSRSQLGWSDTQILDYLKQKDSSLGLKIDKSRALFGKPDAPFQNDKDLTNYLSQKFTGRMPTVPSVPVAGQEKTTEEPKWSDLPGNIIPSTVNMVKGIWDIVRHPIKTVESIGTIGAGLMEMIPGMPQAATAEEEKAAAKAVGHFFVQRYGGLDKIKNTIITDPAGFALDLSSVLGGGGSLLKGAGLAKDATTLGKMGLTAKTASLLKPSALTTVGGAIQKAGKIVDPLAVPGRVLGSAAKVAGKAVKPVLGAFTGAGTANVSEALSKAGTPEFTGSMRGLTGPEEVVGNVTKAFDNIKDNASTTYRSQLQAIEDAQKLSLETIPILKAYKDGLDKFGITKLPDGSLDFSRSTIMHDASAQATLNEINNTLGSWGTKAGDRLPTSLDTLKRAFGDSYSPSSSVRALTTDLYNQTRKILVDQVPGYEKMVGDYEKFAKLKKEIASSLSMSGRAGIETTFKKLTQTMKTDNKVRQSLLDQLQAASNVDLKAQIAGTAFSEFFPRGIPTSLSLGMINPNYLLALIPKAILGSPRLVGEFLNALGISQKLTMKFIKAAKETQAGKVAGKVLEATPNVVKGAYQLKKTQP